MTPISTILNLTSLAVSGAIIALVVRGIYSI